MGEISDDSENELPEIWAALVLTGHGIDPESITHALDILPTKTWREGEAISRTRLTHEDDGWEYATPKARTVEFPELLQVVLDKFQPVREKLLDLAESHGLEVHILCHGYAVDLQPIIHFSHAQIEQISMLKASLDVDVIGISSLDDDD